MSKSSQPSDSDGNSSDAGSRLNARPAEQRLQEIAATLPGNTILATSIGRGQAAESLARARPDASVTCWFMDSHFAALASDHIALHPEGVPANLAINCIADWPEVECDMALLPIHSKSEAELSRDLLQSAFLRLREGGILVAAVDNPKDRWLHDQLKIYSKSVKVRPFDDAVVYFIIKDQPLKRVRDFSCEVCFKDLDVLLKLITRPGVFSHRELDNGARQLLDAVDVYPESRLLDIGCGSGAVSIGLAARDPSARIHAVDSNARAVWCTRKGADINGLTNITYEVNHTGIYGEPNSFDMALANPPYFADFQIAELFIHAAIRSLRPEGRLVLVTKQPKWYEENISRWLDDAEVFASRRYHIVSGIKPTV